MDAGPRPGALRGDRIAIAAYLGSSDVFDHAITQFAMLTPTRTNATTKRARRGLRRLGRLTAERDT